MLEKKKADKEQKRKLRLKRDSEAGIVMPGPRTNLPRTLEQALADSHSTDLQLKEKEQEESTSSDEENSNDILVRKDIERLTGGNLDIKPLNIDFNAMRSFVHTPKDGIRVPMDLTKF